MLTGSWTHKMDFGPLPCFGWEPFANHKFPTMTPNPRRIWCQGQLTKGLKHCHQDLVSLILPGSACLLLNPFLCAYACERRYTWKHAVMCWFWDLKVGRCHQATWIEKAEELRVLFLEKGHGCWAGNNNPWAFYATQEFLISSRSSLQRVEQLLNLLHQQKAWNDVSWCQQYWGGPGIFVHRWGHH